MAALPLSPTKVAGNHSAVYEAYYNYVDPNGYGTVGAMDAARFLKRSGLSDVVLSRVWDLSDPGGRGCLDKTGMFVALKLVALAQQGKDINLSNLGLDMPPPKMGDIPNIKPVKPPPPTNTPLITSLPPSAVDWTIKPSEREKYEKLFDSLEPLNGLIPGNKVKGVLMDSKLPLETLGKIWDLADQDKDGFLDRHEFVAAMHLVYKALEKYAIPSALPPELMPSSKRKNSTPSGPNLLNRGLDGVKPPELPQPPLVSGVPKPVQPVQPQLNWVVTPEERSKSDVLFVKSDIDKDGFVSGQEIKDVFLQSGVPPPVLAHIWALCDIKQCGKLNNEQFALAMWFVARCLKGIDLPTALTPDMVPPTFRTTKPTDGLVENNNTRYSNPELDMISKDIEELAREKLALETDIAQREADIKIKSGEIKSLQSELDTLAATFKQLENQKGEAQKRLNDLKAQKTTIDSELEDMDKQIAEQKEKVEKLKSQAAEQAEVISAQESELTSKKEQLEGLKREEQKLEQIKNENTRKLEKLTNSLQDTQLTISQVKNMITQLQEQTRQMNDAISACDNAITAGDVTTVPDSALRITPDFRDSEYRRLSSTEEIKMQNGFGDSQDDPFSNTSAAATTAGFQDDPFKNDPFKSNSDAFEPSDPFKASFSNPTVNDGFSPDPFGSSFTSDSNKPDPFNAFGDKNPSTVSSTAPAPSEPDKDPFGCDPFAVLHAPTRDGGPPPGRPSSPSPALPPKKSKQPPPRPAPPRPMQPSGGFKTGSSDPFSSQGSDSFGSSGGGFEGFADFDSKFSNKRPPAAAPAPAPPKQKSLDFTDDPFRNYRYEDPFDITFDDDAAAAAASSPSGGGGGGRTDAFGLPVAASFDPFGLHGRQSVPLPEVGAATADGRKSAPLGGRAAAAPREDEQLAWAATESLKLEEARKRRQRQEEADLALAIQLSKNETKSK